MATLDELRERKAKREAEAAQARADRECAVLELEESCEQTHGGGRGHAFEIVDIDDEPLVVVKAGPSVLFKQFRESKMTYDDVQRFVAACVQQPDKKAFADLVERKAGALVRVFDALVALYRGEAAVEGKRY